MTWTPQLSHDASACGSDGPLTRGKPGGEPDRVAPGRERAEGRAGRSADTDEDPRRTSAHDDDARRPPGWIGQIEYVDISPKTRKQNAEEVGRYIVGSGIQGVLARSAAMTKVWGRACTRRNGRIAEQFRSGNLPRERRRPACLRLWPVSV